MKSVAHRSLKSERGITLIELLIVAVIVAILAGISIPMYTGYMQRARRADAKTALEQLRASQEMRRAERGSYLTDMAALQTTWGGPTSPSGDYNITMVATSTTFTGRATPVTGRQTSDGWLEINQNGRKIDQDGKIWPEGKWGK